MYKLLVLRIVTWIYNYFLRIIILLLLNFSHQLMVFPSSLSVSKSPQVSRTLLSILADRNNAVVWMVSICPLISKSSSPCTNPLVTVPRLLITIGITYTYIFHSFFQFSSKFKVLIFLFAFFQFYPVVSRNGKIDYSEASLFLCWLSPGLVVWKRLDDPFVSQNPREFCVAFFGRILGYAYTICSFGQI